MIEMWEFPSHLLLDIKEIRKKRRRRPKKKYPGDLIEPILEFLMGKVCEFFDYQKTHGHVNWKASEETQRAYLVMGLVHRWWKKERPALEKKADKIRSELSGPRISKKGHLEFSPKERRICRRAQKVERQIWMRDQELLHDIIQVRACLFD